MAPFTSEYGVQATYKKGKKKKKKKRKKGEYGE
jgi:hypothetical protein